MCENKFNFFPFIFLGEFVVVVVVVVLVTVEPFEAGVGDDVFDDISVEFSMTLMCFLCVVILFIYSKILYWLFLLLISSKSVTSSFYKIDKFNIMYSRCKIQKTLISINNRFDWSS